MRTLIVLLLESNSDGTVDNNQGHHGNTGADNQGVQFSVSNHFVMCGRFVVGCVDCSNLSRLNENSKPLSSLTVTPYERHVYTDHQTFIFKGRALRVSRRKKKRTPT